MFYNYRSSHRDNFRKYLFFSSRSTFFWTFPGGFMCWLPMNRYRFYFFKYHRTDRQFPGRYPLRTDISETGLGGCFRNYILNFYKPLKQPSALYNFPILRIAFGINEDGSILPKLKWKGWLSINNIMKRSTTSAPQRVAGIFLTNPSAVFYLFFYLCFFLFFSFLFWFFIFMIINPF